MNSNMAEVKFNRGTYSKSIVDSLKDGELFFDANADTTSAAGNQGIYMGVAQADGTVKPVKVAMGIKQYMSILDRAFIRGRAMTDNIYMFTDDTATGLRYAPSIFTGRTGFNLIVGKKGTGSGPFDGRNYSAASMWAGESFGGKLTLNGWTKGIDDLKAGNSFDLSSFFLPNGFDVSVFREGSTTAMDAVVGVFHCKGTYGISHKNGTINDVTGLFIDPNKTTNARVGVVILGKTDDDLLTANGSTVPASGFAKTTDIPTVNDPKITIKMNGAEKGSFTLNQASAGEVDLGVIDTTIADNSITTSKIVDGAVTSTKLATGARKPIIFTPDTTEVDEETYQKLLSDDVDVLLMVFENDNTCTLTHKIVKDQSLELYFTCLSFEGETIDECYIFGYLMTITKNNPHTCSITENINGALDDFLNDSGYLNKSTLSTVLQEIDLTGTDADRKAKLDQFETDWKALTGAGDMTGARFVGYVEIENGYVTRVLLNYDMDGNYSGICTTDSEETKLKKILVQPSNGYFESTSLFSHLEPVEIFTDNTTESKKKNIGNLNDYKVNLENLGVDGSSSFQVPIYISSGMGVEQSGFLVHSNLPGVYKPYSGLVLNADSVDFLLFGISKTGEFIEQTYYLADINYSSLTTTSKKVVGAINEVNALAKSKQDALTSGTNIKTVNGQSLLGSGDIAISAGRKSVTIAIAGAETTLTAAQAASFHDPDTDVIIDMGAGLLVTHIYQYDDTGKVVYRMYDGTIMASADTGGIAYMQFYEENNKLTYTTGALPVPIALTSTEVTNIWNTTTA